MAAAIYEKPLPIKRRPYGSYRIDVYSLKAGRRMTLYGKPTLSQFIQLEADRDVSALCERPLLVPGARPDRFVDFWALRSHRPNFYLLINSTGKQTDRNKGAFDNFRKWVKAQGGELHDIDVKLLQEQRVRHTNWATMLQHLAAHRGQVSAELLERCTLVMEPSFTLSQLENKLDGEEPMMVRAAVYHLIGTGRLRCPTIDEEFFHAGTVVERP